MSTEILTSAEPVHRTSRMRRLAGRFNGLFIVIVLLPSLGAAVYYGLIASDVFISESRFVVRSPQRSLQGGIGALLQGTVLGRSQDDTYSVHDYINSRDALRELDEKLKVRAAYSRGDISVFNRFPGLSPDASFEAFYLYYQDHILIDYDTASSITELRVRAFSAAEARDINQQLLQMSERLVNNVNLRSRQDLIQVAQQEVQQAEDKARQAGAALSALRSGRGVFDPEKQGGLQLAAVAKLEDQLHAAEAQLTQLVELSPQNPQIGPLKSQVRSLRALIASETAKVTGAGRSLAANSPEFERALLEKEVSDKRLTEALAGLDSARSEASRKQMYLERLVEPNLPDIAIEPRRIRSTITVFAVGLIVWAVASLVVASVREHTD
jgi:capsular polysaccharide transport system permease protein